MNKENQKPEVKPEIVELSKQLSEGIEVDSKTGSVKVADGLYDSVKIEGVTKAQQRAIYDHDVTFIAAATNAAATKVYDAMSKNKKLEEVKVSIPMFGRDSLELGIRQKVDVTNPKEPEKKITKYGQVRVDFNKFADHGNAGQLGAVRSALAEMALKKLA